LYFGPARRGHAAESDGLTARVPDREHDATAERVLEPVGLVHERETRVDDVVAGELLLLQMRARDVEAVGRPTEREATRRVTFEPTTPQVAACGAGTLGLEQELVVEGDRLPHRFLQSHLALAIGRVRRVVVAQRDARTRRQALHRVDEVEMLELTNERDCVATALATEAKKYLLLGLIENDGDFS